jgi:hypothetical protein
MGYASENIHELLSKEMDRRDFLKTLGILLLAIFGVSRLLDAFRTMGNTNSDGKSASGGYGR